METIPSIHFQKYKALIRCYTKTHMISSVWIFHYNQAGIEIVELWFSFYLDFFEIVLVLHLVILKFFCQNTFTPEFLERFLILALIELGNLCAFISLFRKLT